MDTNINDKSKQLIPEDIKYKSSLYSRNLHDSGQFGYTIHDIINAYDTGALEERKFGKRLIEKELELEDKVSAWHMNKKRNEPLHVYLDMSLQEYKAYAKNGEIPIRMIMYDKTT